MKKLLLIAGVLMLSACSTQQIADSKFSCGGTASLDLEYFPEGDRVKRVIICSGTEGEKSARYELRDTNGNLVKLIEVSGSGIHTARALEAVGATLKAASSDDAKTKQAAITALPKVLGALVRLSSPIP